MSVCECLGVCVEQSLLVVLQSAAACRVSLGPLWESGFAAQFPRLQLCMNADHAVEVARWVYRQGVESDAIAASLEGHALQHCVRYSDEHLLVSRARRGLGMKLSRPQSGSAGVYSDGLRGGSP